MRSTSTYKRTSAFFIAIFGQNTDQDIAFAVVAGKKTFPKSVSRNFAKRRLRHLLRQASHIHLKGVDIILISRAAITNAKFSEAKARLESDIESYIRYTKRKHSE